MSSMRRNTGRDRRGGQRIFSPLQLMGGIQAAWYRADRGVTGSPNITALADLSGQGRNLSANVNSPTLVTDGGLPAIRMDGTSVQELRVAAPASCAFAYTLAICAKIDTTTVASNRVFGVNRSRGIALGTTAATYQISHVGAVGITVGAQDTANYKTMIVTGGSASPFTPVLYVNGASVTPNSPAGNQTYLNATSVGDFISIGFDTVSCKGYVRECIWLDRIATAGEIAALHNYLSQWGVA